MVTGDTAANGGEKTPRRFGHFPCRERLQAIHAAPHLAQQRDLCAPAHPRRKQVIQLGEHEGREQQRPIVTGERLSGVRVKTLGGI